MASGCEGFQRAFVGNVQANHEKALEQLLAVGLTAATLNAGGRIISYILDEVWEKKKDEPDPIILTIEQSQGPTEALSAQRPRHMEEEFDVVVKKCTPEPVLPQ